MKYCVSPLLGAAVAALLAGACTDKEVVRADEKPAASAAAPVAHPVLPAAAPAPSSVSPLAQAIDAAVYVATDADKEASRRMLIKAQVLLDRARFSPGVIDGEAGENLRQALAAFEKANELTIDGKLDEQTWAALTQVGPGPVMQDYTITAEDVAGPFLETLPKDYEALSKLEKLSYTGPIELLAEKFHMDEALLKGLNPQADFAVAGTVIIVARPRDGALPEVARIEVDKAERELRAYGADDRLLAVYPATVGSSSRPAPSGEWAVNTVAPDPTWNYDPKRLSFGDASRGKFQIAAGPNNPVGAVWIDLTKETYGIHGTPEPRLVGKVDSHGCVRLTNWDAKELSKSVKKGTKVVFTGSEKTPPKVRAVPKVAT